MTKPEDNEEMSPQFAVFNQHINDAEAKARKIFIAEYGLKTWHAKIVDVAQKGGGIMTIFNEPPNEWTKFYVDAVMLFVNKGRTSKVTE